MNNVAELWVYLSEGPLVWLTATLVAYLAADAIAARCNRHPLANPVMIAVAMVSCMLMVTGTPFQRYFAGAQFVHFLLGPATVALAVPLWEHRARVRAALVPMALALLFGVTTAIVSTVLMARALQLPDDLVLALAPKSATAPIAMGVAQTLGAEPALTAILVITTGVVGAIVVTPLMNALRLTDWAARGFAAGLASHGIGTARAFQVHPLAGTFAGIAIGLSGLATALLAPLIVPLLMR